FASLVGLAAGVGLAKGLSSLFSALGLALPEAGLPIETRTIIVPLALGTILTVVAGLIPAVRATRVPAISAVREGADATLGRGGRTAPIVAATLGTVSAVLLGYGFTKHGIPVPQRLV